jgi:hypothetical protein
MGKVVFCHAWFIKHLSGFVLLDELQMVISGGDTEISVSRPQRDP